MSPSAATDCGQQDLGPESEKDPDVIPPNKGKQKIHVFNSLITQPSNSGMTPSSITQVVLL